MWPRASCSRPACTGPGYRSWRRPPRPGGSGGDGMANGNGGNGGQHAMKSRPPVAALTDAFGVDLDPPLLERALTHRSYAYENGGLPTNERLEFLGDSVLGVVVTTALFNDHPDLPEGQLAKL